jgi:transposase-like protein
MPAIILRLPKKAQKPNGRPGQCPRCGSYILHQWGQVDKSINDGSEVITVKRFRCTDCGSTFRYYPDGYDQSKYSHSVRRLAAITWLLGLSYREAADLFERAGIEISHTTIWREGRKLAKKLDKHIDHVEQVYSLDKKYIHKLSVKFGVVVAIDFGDESLKILGTVDEFNPRPVLKSLQSLVADTDIRLVQLGTSALNMVEVQA